MIYPDGAPSNHPVDPSGPVPSLIPIALCADDYAQNQAIDDGILSLLAEQRLSAVSCFSTAPRWRQQSAPALREVAAAGAADVGLHFNLTEGFGQKPRPIGCAA